MIVVSLDQALKTSGYAVYQDGKLITSGTFSIPANKPIEERLFNFWKELNNLYNTYDFDKLIFEDIQYQNNAETHKKLAYVQASILLWAYNQNVKFEIYSPSHWRSILKDKCKISFCKSRTEQKAIARQLVKDRFQIDVSEDEADAVCIGLAYHLSSKKESVF